jgi:hypothetical protein
VDSVEVLNAALSPEAEVSASRGDEQGHETGQRVTNILKRIQAEQRDVLASITLRFDRELSILHSV